METLFGEEDGPGREADTAHDRAPLATRLRPATLADFVGQQHLLGAGAALRRAIEEGNPHSMVLHGPPGSGKTTLARIVAAEASAAFEEESAVAAGRAEVRAVIERARHRRATTGEATIFFLDEIHRFNKAQQDALLPAVEEGLITLIGATTENPYFEVNSALLSRARVYELQALGTDDVRRLLDRALERSECGDVEVEPRGTRVPGRALGWGCAHGAQRARARVRGVGGGPGRSGRRRGRRWSTARSRWPMPRMRFSVARCSTTARRIATTTRSRPG